MIYLTLSLHNWRIRCNRSSVERGKIILAHTGNKLVAGILIAGDYMIEKENMLIVEARASRAKYEYFLK
jgi:hypothetical protein